MPIRDDDGFFDELSRLTNELVDLQRDLAKKNAELERLGQLKNLFLGMATHDLRRPLGAILSYSELVIEEGGFSNDQGVFLSRIRDAAQSMSRIVDDFLDLAVIESGRFALQLEKFELSSLLERVMAVTQRHSTTRGVPVELVLESQLLAVEADPAKLEQVLVNLVTNAVEHSPSGASVQLRVHDDERWLNIDVVDHGSGIAASAIEKLFEPWETARRNPGRHGAGLGLAIARKIAQAHCGDITVSSREAEGSVFTVRLPMNAKERTP